MAKISKIIITYGRKFNLGEFNQLHAEIALESDPLTSDDDPLAVANDLWDFAKNNVKTNALPAIKEAKASQAAAQPTGKAAAAAPAGAAPSASAPAASVKPMITVKVKSYGIAATQGGDAYVKFKGGRFTKHGIPLYDDQMPESFLESFPGWASWPIGDEYTDVPDFMTNVLYDPNTKKIVGFAE